MEKCRACGADLFPDSRFCGHCGTAREAIAPPGELTQPGSLRLAGIPPALDPAATLIQGPQTPLPPTAPAGENRSTEATESPTTITEQQGEEEKNRGSLLDLAAPALLLEGQAAPAPRMPVIQGTPQISSIPGLPGTPQPGSLPPGASSPLQPVHASGDPGLHHGWQQPGGQAAQHTAGHAFRAAAGKTAGSLAVKWIVIIITTIVVIAGSAAGVLAYVLTRPQPIISVTSPYKVGKTPAGSSGTSLHVKGQQFSGNSAITFLLDNRPAPGEPRISSDSKGNISVNLPVTSAWTTGPHTLTGRDAQGYTTKVGIVIKVVAQGVANTPGPLGAPPDDASFKISINLQGQYDQGGGSFSGTETEIVTGHPDPAGGSVCQPEDDGQPHQYSSQTLNTGIPETQTLTASCSGTYKGGTLNLTETLLSDTVQLNDNGAQITCQLLTPGVDEQLTGSYTAQGTFSGTITYLDFPRSDFSCTNGPFSSFYFFLYGGSGTWTGTIVSS